MGDFDDAQPLRYIRLYITLSFLEEKKSPKVPPNTYKALCCNVFPRGDFPKKSPETPYPFRTTPPRNHLRLRIG